MKTENKKYLLLAVIFLSLFILWTILICFVDTESIGPKGSSVGFAAANGFFHKLIGVNLFLYTVTDYLGIIPLFFALGFAILGLIQWIQRKSLLKVDLSILLLGAFYIITLGVFIFFEIFPINFRPILIEGILEASYPSSTTMLSLCILPTTMIQLGSRIENSVFRKTVLILLALFTAFMVIGRILSGVHWLSDIIGGALFSIGLVSLYAFFANKYPMIKKS